MHRPRWGQVAAVLTKRPAGTPPSSTDGYRTGTCNPETRQRPVIGSPCITHQPVLGRQHLPGGARRGEGSGPRAGSGLVLGRRRPWWSGAQAKPSGHKGLRAAASRNKPEHVTSDNSRSFIFSPFRPPPCVPVPLPPQCVQYAVPNPWTMD